MTITNDDIIVKNKFSQIPNIVFDKILLLKLSGIEFKVLIYIIRQTLGFKKTTFNSSPQKIGKRVGTDRRTVKRALDKLKELTVIEVKSINGVGTKIKIKPPKQWDCTIEEQIVSLIIGKDDNNV